MVESYLVFLSKHCKLYTKDISYYFCVYKEDYFIAFINHLYHSSTWRVHISWAGCWLTSSLSHLCWLHGVRSARNGWAALGAPALEWQQHCSLQLRQHVGLETAQSGAVLATVNGTVPACVQNTGGKDHEIRRVSNIAKTIDSQDTWFSWVYNESPLNNVKLFGGVNLVSYTMRTVRQATLGWHPHCWWH